MIKLNVKDKTYELNVKQTIKSVFLFETITKKAFSIATYLDNVTYLYCILLASNENFDVPFVDFIEAIDCNPSILNEITAQLEQATKFSNQFAEKDDEKEGKKKGKSRKLSTK